jgi:hypothetical protein
MILKERTTYYNLSLRPAECADEAFLVTLYANTRRDEVTIFSWSREQQNAFFKMQFEMQTRAYKIQFPDAATYIVELEKLPAGRLIVERGEREIKLIDIRSRKSFAIAERGRFCLKS